jgi:guanine nucleotide-binding protein subunit alpha
MRLIYTRDGFTKNEKAEWRIIIFQNIIDGLRMIVDAMEEFEIGFEFENTTVRYPDMLPRRYASPHLPLTDPRPTFPSLWRRKT